jgi:hypothetical protein
MGKAQQTHSCGGSDSSCGGRVLGSDNITLLSWNVQMAASCTLPRSSRGSTAAATLLRTTSRLSWLGLHAQHTAGDLHADTADTGSSSSHPESHVSQAAGDYQPVTDKQVHSY